MTSNATCPSPIQDTSNAITMTVTPRVTPTISITTVGGINTACNGDTIRFNAAVTNGGSTPAYQWKVNSANAGANSSSFVTSTLANGDIVTCVLTSSVTCVTAATAGSNAIALTIRPVVTPSITITASPGNSVCAQKPVTFTAVPVNGGTAPVRQWKVNGINTGSNSNTFFTTALNTGDIVNCQLASNAGCVTSPYDTSNDIVMAITPAVVPSVTITASPGTDVGSGATVTFTANVVNGGTSPGYQWKKNNVNVGTNSSTYTDAKLVHNDEIKVTIQSDDSCAVPISAISNRLIMRVTTGINQERLFDDLTLYPNPNQGRFTLSGTLKLVPRNGISLELQSMLGQPVYSETIPVVSQKISHVIELPGIIADGVYMLRIVCGDRTLVRQISISR
jgi:hypothetical protein